MLCGKPIVSFDDLLNKYANDSYRIYLTTDTFFSQLADQLNQYNVTNYTFYRDFIPEYDAVKQLVFESISVGDRVGLLGTNNVTELVLAAFDELNLHDCVNTIFDILNT